MKKGAHMTSKTRVLEFLLFSYVVLLGGILIYNGWQSAGSEDKAVVSVSDEGITIENKYISRQLEIKDGHINTSAIVNKRIEGNEKIEMQEGSEDFAIHLLDEDYPSKELNKTGWKITITDGNNVQAPWGESARLIDGAALIPPRIVSSVSENTVFMLDLDLGSEQTVSSFSIDKRGGECDRAEAIAGTLGKYKLYVSDDGVNYIPAGEGEFTQETYHLHEDAGICPSHYRWENHIYNVGNRVYANFDDTYTIRYVRVVQESGIGGVDNDSFSSAEISLYEDFYQGTGYAEIDENTIVAGELVYADAKKEKVDSGRKLTIYYEPVEVGSTTYDIQQVIILGDEDFYLRSFLEIQTSDKEKARIDYIDTNRFVLSEDVKDVWDEGMFALGQPIYAGGLFMGSEFPAVHTWISHENATQIRYYSGKSFERMEEDGQLTNEGKFVTWPGVIGVAWDSNINVVQSALYSYIEEIATPTTFRKQYNSWFDNLMGITDENMEEMFLGVEKGLSQNGIEPLDCYVVDDGWNNYYDGIYQTESGENQGTTVNRTGFWETNAKFPDEMYTAMELADRLQSTLGMWLGPQGGYNYDKTFSQFLEQSGTGNIRTSNTGSGTILPSYSCVASEQYVENLEKFMLDYNSRFDITYWKVDGLGSACQNLAHGHMTGGYSDMYYTSDMWEKWTRLFDNIRAENQAEGKELFINATNGTMLSPWVLQWVNTVWLNAGSDTGELGTGERHQQKIYYRDQIYYNQFNNERQIQFPLGHIYTHDPIYGVKDGSSATPEVFREYLFVNAMRGTAFWELYFSPSLMDDTYWKIVSDVLMWAEENQEILKTAKYFGNDPAEGVYGYACFKENQGIISFTNPLDVPQTYVLKVDGIVGADKELSKAGGFQVHPYKDAYIGELSYGDTITIELEPHQTVIQQYGKVDHEKPEIISARSEGEDKIILKFNERIYLDTAQISGVEVEAVLQADYRTVVLQTQVKLIGSKEVRVYVRDMNGNAGEATTTAVCCGKDNTIMEVTDTDHIRNGGDIQTVHDKTSGKTWLSGIDKKYEVLADQELCGKGAFTIGVSIQTESSNKDILTVGDHVKLSVNRDGYVEFCVGDVIVESKRRITNVTEKAYGTFGTDAYVPTQIVTKDKGVVNDGNTHMITAVRETNGILKLYLDGELYASGYDENCPNMELDGGSIHIADKRFGGKMAQVFILNDALGYDEIAAYTSE